MLEIETNCIQTYIDNLKQITLTTLEISIIYTPCWQLAFKLNQMSYTKRKCNNCGNEYLADNRNLKRGWGLCCSKRCAAKKREMSRPDYNSETVSYNNLKRAGLLPRETNYVEMYHNSTDCDNDQWGDCEHGIHD